MVTDAQRKATGTAGEDAAAGFLAGQGWCIVARNWHCKQGELDIVAVKDGVIAFVEVKTRKSGAMVTPLAAVDARKQRRTVLAASSYLAAHRCTQLQPRFDVMAVTVNGNAFAVEHYPSAFGAGGYY